MGNTESATLRMSEVDFESYTGVRYTKELPDSREPNRGPVYCSGMIPLHEPRQTLYHCFLRGAAMDGGQRPLYGTRRIENGKAGAYEWLTYVQVKNRTDAIAAGLVHGCELQRQDCVGIFSKNRVEWCLASHGCDRMSFVVVPLYDTLGPDAVPYIVNHTDLKVLFCAAEQLGVVLECKPACPSLQIVIQFEDVTDEQRKLAMAKNLQLKSLKELEALGQASPVPADPPSPHDIATLCYTSGTTGKPKGAILTHCNIACVTEISAERLPLLADDVHISYMPLAHVFERGIISGLTRNGASAGFYQGDVLLLLDDIATLKPTVFVSVPRLFNRVYDKITQGVAAAGGMKKALFNQAMAAKKAGLPAGHKTHALWDTLVFSKIRMVLGGRVRAILSGSAPLSAEVKEFLKIAFCCDVMEGYGLSETGSSLSAASSEMPLGPHVGPPVSNLLVCLEDVPEMNYTSDDKPRPRGEILVKGPVVFQGYYKEPELTTEAIDKDGWFHTGDIGCWNADGSLSIIDRKKNIFKLSQGEYVAAEKIENVYAKSRFVAQIFVYGDSRQSCLVAVVVPDPEIAEAWAQTQGLSKRVNVTENVQFQAALLEDMHREGEAAQLRGFEFVKKVHFHAEPFSMADGLITPTFKLKRPQLKVFFQNQLDAMYAQIS